MPLYIGDYLAATAHLDAQESGAYLHLLMHAWKNGALPSDPARLRMIARIPEHAWSNAWETLRQFFTLQDGQLVQGRLEEIRSEWTGKKKNASEKASRAARKRWGDARSMPQALPEHSPSPSPLTTEREREAGEAAAADVMTEPAAPATAAPAPPAQPAEDLQPVVAQIILAHPRARLRNWTQQDIPYADRIATLAALRHEAEVAHAPPLEAGLQLLELVEGIAQHVPEGEWRYLKDIAEFMRLREYRVKPEHLTRNGNGGAHAPTQPNRTNGGARPSPNSERRARSREGIWAAAEYFAGAGGDRADGAGGGPVPAPGAGSADHPDVHGGVAGDGGGLRGKPPGRVVEGHFARAGEAELLSHAQ